MPSSSVTILSKSTVYPHQKSILTSLKLSVSDLPMLSCQYIQKGVLLSQAPLHIDSLISLLKLSLSKTLSLFSPLAGRLYTDPEGHVSILCNDSGVDFFHATAKTHFVNIVLDTNNDVDECFKRFFQYDNTLSYAGHEKPLLAVQVTELNDGVFIGCTINHAVVDGTSFWNFFNTYADVAKGVEKMTKSPDFRRDTVFNSLAVLQFPVGGPSVTFSGDELLRERVFHFSREAIMKLKLRANRFLQNPEISEFFGNIRNGSWKEVSGDKGKINGVITTISNGKTNGVITTVNGAMTSVFEELVKNSGLKPTALISSFQSLCAHLWRAVTRARNLDVNKTTTFRMAVNCRHRLEPRLDMFYFGNAIQSIPTVALVGELLSRDLYYSADLLHQNVVDHDDATVRKGVKDWESNPRLFPLGNFDGAMITMGSSPRFPMYDNDFGWGRPLAVRSGRANKFDGKISAFPGWEGNGSVDLEVVLAPETMARLESDIEFMQFIF